MKRQQPPPTEGDAELEQEREEITCSPHETLNTGILKQMLMLRVVCSPTDHNTTTLKTISEALANEGDPVASIFDSPAMQHVLQECEERIDQDDKATKFMNTALNMQGAVAKFGKLALGARALIFPTATSSSTGVELGDIDKSQLGLLVKSLAQGSFSDELLPGMSDKRGLDVVTAILGIISPLDLNKLDNSSKKVIQDVTKVAGQIFDDITAIGVEFWWIVVRTACEQHDDNLELKSSFALIREMLHHMFSGLTSLHNMQNPAVKSFAICLKYLPLEEWMLAVVKVGALVSKLTHARDL